MGGAGEADGMFRSSAPASSPRATPRLPSSPAPSRQAASPTRAQQVEEEGANAAVHIEHQVGGLPGWWWVVGWGWGAL